MSVSVDEIIWKPDGFLWIFHPLKKPSTLHEPWFTAGEADIWDPTMDVFRIRGYWNTSGF